MATKTAAKTVTVKGATLSFPKVFKAEAYAEGQKPRFSTTLLFDPGSEAVKVIRGALNDIVREQWDGKKPNGLEVCLHEGDKKIASARNPENYEMYAGKLYVTASTSADTPPVIVDLDGRTPLVVSSGKIYGGAIVDAVLRLWGQDNKWGIRINAELKGLRWRGKGTPFGSGGPIDPSAYFDEVEEVAEAWDDAPF